MTENGLLAHFKDLYTSWMRQYLEKQSLGSILAATALSQMWKQRHSVRILFRFLAVVLPEHIQWRGTGRNRILQTGNLYFPL